MKVLTPTPLMREAAAVLEPIVDEVVVIGAVAVAVALTHSQQSPAELGGATRDLDIALIAPTRDVDLAVRHDRAAWVIEQLIRQDLRPSEMEGERGFTWQRDDLKIQLMTPPSPRRRNQPPVLPIQPALSIASDHHLDVAFVEEPTRRRMRCATAGALVVLKRAAFGRSRHDGTPIERDYHDVVALLSGARQDLLAEAASGDHTIRTTLQAVCEQLDTDSAALGAAARERLRLGLNRNQREAELAVRRTVQSFARELAAGQ